MFNLSEHHLKKLVIALFLFIFGMQIIQSLLWREDYPFTRWGMYHMFPNNITFIDVMIEIDRTDVQAHQVLEAPWHIAFGLREMFGIDIYDVQTLEKPIDQYIEKYEGLIEAKREEINSLFEGSTRDRFTNCHKPLTLKAYIKGWKKLTYESSKEPDLKVKIYEKTLPTCV